MNFNNWLNTFVEEKSCLNKSNIFKVKTDKNTHMMDLGYIVDFMCSCDNDTKKGFKKSLVYIDYKDGNPGNFFHYVAKGIVEFYF